MNAKFVPDNLPDCFAMIERSASAKALGKLRSRSHDELIQEHFFGWGLFLRNRFIHPRHSPLREKIALLPTMSSHADDCGRFLLEALWLHLNGRDDPAAILELLLTAWQGVASAAPQMFKAQELENFLELWQDAKPTLEDVLPLFQPIN